MKNTLKNVIFFLLFCALLTGSVYGVMLPSNPRVSAVGAMQIAPFSDGLSLFQDYRRLYYRFSPFNDYLIDADGNRSTLISITEIQKKQYSTDVSLSHPNAILNSVQTYLTNGSPDLTVNTQRITAYYRAQPSQNQISITHTVALKAPQNIRKLGSTLAYHGDDLVFDRDLNAYNYWDTEDLTAFEQNYGTTLLPKNERLRINVPGKEIFIMNPRAAFVIVVRANQNQTLTVNRDAKLIELEETVQPGQELIGTVNVEIFQNPKEVL